MSIASEQNEAHFERSRWYAVKGLEGKVFSTMEELILGLPADVKTVEQCQNGFTYYRAGFGVPQLSLKIAYDCETCKGIVAATPTIESYDNMRPLSGSRGIHYSCSKCNTRLHDSVTEMS